MGFYDRNVMSCPCHGWHYHKEADGRQSLTQWAAMLKKLAVHRGLYPSVITENWAEGNSVSEKGVTINRDNNRELYFH